MQAKPSASVRTRGAPAVAADMCGGALGDHRLARIRRTPKCRPRNTTHSFVVANSGGGALTACCDGSRYGGGKRWSAYKKSVEALNCTNGVFGDPAPFSPKVCSCRSGVWLPVVDDALWFGKFPRVRQIAYHESLVLKL